jgi:hypothetical protein
MHRIFLTLVIARQLHPIVSFHIGTPSKCIKRQIRHIMSMIPKPSIKKVDFSGLTDQLTSRIANDLNLDKYLNKNSDLGDQSISIAQMTPEETRQVLADFVEHHPDAERQVARLVLQHLGINKSVFLSPQVSCITNDSAGQIMASPTSSFVDLNESIPLKHSDDDIMPNLSPVSWLSEDSWSSMSYNDKLGLMEHLTNGKFRR